MQRKLVRGGLLLVLATLGVAIGLTAGDASYTRPVPAVAATQSDDTLYLPVIGDGTPLSITALASAMGAGGTYPIIGELRNNGTTPIISTTLSISADGEIFTEKPIFTAILPGRTNYFFVARTRGEPPTVMGADVAALEENHSVEYEALRVVTVSPDPDYALGSVSGTIRNDGAATVRQVEVLAVLRSPGGALIQAAPAIQLSRTILAPGETATFYVPMIGYRFHPTATAEVYAQGVVAP